MRTFELLLGPPLLAAALALVAVPFRPAVAWVNAVLSLVSLGAAFALGYQVVGGEALVAGWQDILRADALSALLAVCVTIVTALAAWLGPGLEGGDEPRRARRYQIFVNLFAFTMLCAVTTNNVGLMWVAIEATTIASAMLIALDVSKASVEASWKYVLLGSVGIALAFAGTVLAYFDFVRLADSHEAVLNWTVLRAAAPNLRPEVMQLAFVFILVGYGTKAGLAPMHTWLPDAHAEAPAPVSAMMSGVLLAVALHAIVRWKARGQRGRRPRLSEPAPGAPRDPVAHDRGLQPRDAAQLQADARLLEHRAHGAHVRGARARRAGRDRVDAAPPEPHAGEGRDVPARGPGPRSVPDDRHRGGVRPAPDRCPAPAGCSWRAPWPWSASPRSACSCRSWRCSARASRSGGPGSWGSCWRS